MGASAIHVRRMDKLTEDAVREIEQIQSTWIEFEIAGEDDGLMALCADDIELWPPDAPPLLLECVLIRFQFRIQPSNLVFDNIQPGVFHFTRLKNFSHRLTDPLATGFEFCDQFC